MGTAPRRTIVGEDRRWQAVPLETAGQVLLNQQALFMGTCPQPQHEPRMVIDEGQRVDPAPLHGAVAHEVELDQVVRGGVFEPPVAQGAAGRRIDQPGAMEDTGNRARGGRRQQIAPILQPGMDLATAPGRMRGPDRDDAGFDVRRRLGRGGVGTPGAIPERLQPPVRARSRHFLPVVGEIPNRRQRARRFAPSWSAIRTNSRRSSIVVVTLNGMVTRSFLSS